MVLWNGMAKQLFNMKLFLYTLLLLVTLSCAETTKGEIELVTQEEMELLLKEDQVQLIDVRTLKEYNAGFIANAQNIDFFAEDFEVQVSKLDKTKPVIVYCQKGGRSAKCAEKMKNLGFTKIYDLDGGYSKWTVSN